MSVSCVLSEVGVNGHLCFSNLRKVITCVFVSSILRLLRYGMNCYFTSKKCIVGRFGLGSHGNSFIWLCVNDESKIVKILSKSLSQSQLKPAVNPK